MTFPATLQAERARLNLSQGEAAAMFPTLLPDQTPLTRRMWAKWEQGAGEPPGYVQRLLIEKLQRQKKPRTTGHFAKPGQPSKRKAPKP